MKERWSHGESVVQGLLDQGDLEQIGPESSNGLDYLQQAVGTLAVARAALGIDLRAAYVNAYDAARLAGTALLIQQGLRPTSKGGHWAVEKALGAQFNTVFRGFGNIRRRRNVLEYPGGAEGASATSRSEAEWAIATAEQFEDRASRLIDRLGFFQASGKVESKQARRTGPIQGRQHHGTPRGAAGPPP